MNWFRNCLTPSQILNNIVVAIFARFCRPIGFGVGTVGPPLFWLLVTGLVPSSIVVRVSRGYSPSGARGHRTSTGETLRARLFVAAPAIMVT